MRSCRRLIAASSKCWLFRGPVPMIGGAPVLAGATTAAVVVLSAAVMVAIVDGMRVWRTGP
jgi:hypothetical protein